MTGWIVIAALYVLNLLAFRWLGGIGSAQEALRRWGRSAAASHRNRGSAGP